MIQHNGFGVVAFDGGRVTIIQGGAIIQNNAGDGLVLIGGSSLFIQDSGTAIKGNSGNGVTIRDTSVLIAGLRNACLMLT